MPDHASGSLGGLPTLPEAEALDVAVRGDPLRLGRRLHLVDLHLASRELLERNGNGSQLFDRSPASCVIDMQPLAVHHR